MILSAAYSMEPSSIPQWVIIRVSIRLTLICHHLADEPMALCIL